ncbi:uncharacterized protein LOC131334477 isoform X2 [Rhododendron vialii]|uniref:uncharacterized protein LOC131334477 isoform X2 n=1 Tax=Rhododendron vialii TaxID=182163 RepID=UPI00265D6A4F|nr:uncharacterized protein LOC131334477 isoform X2 [Rhododendron vialii]
MACYIGNSCSINITIYARLQFSTLIVTFSLLFQINGEIYSRVTEERGHPFRGAKRPLESGLSALRTTRELQEGMPRIACEDVSVFASIDMFGLVNFHRSSLSSQGNGFVLYSDGYCVSICLHCCFGFSGGRQ